ncbi:MAG: Na+ dependent nucleoside transporter domain protein, partial [Caulobacteraceae bacterium]|nr:Na+ dependent nucleoside transporter domain protein [Caulobacteraceae bacterium]
WRTVLWGIGLQFAFAILIMYTGPGKALFIAGQDLVRHLNDFASEGASLVFGPLASPDSLGKAFGPANRIVFAVSISATVILVSALSSLLYHWGILQQVVRAIATVMMKAMGTSGSESLAAASNIFLGQTEAALVIKPYIARMTRSEVMALMTTGMATIATGVMVVYGTMDGIDAGHILTASVLSAPAGLLIAKIMVPETEQSETGTLHHFGTERTTVNAIDALCQGASEGVSLSINIMGMLIAFVATVALANALLAWPQTLLHVDHPITFQQIAGWLNAPFAWLIGIPAKDCGFIGQVLGQRIVLNEFIGYLALSEHVKTNPGSLDPRSITLASYALCGFANFTSIAIQIGGISALAPSRRVHLAELGFRSMIGGLLACYLTATVVGVLL